MASQGPNSCGTGANDASAGTVSWNNPGNIVSSNNVYSTVVGGSGSTQSKYLKATNFGFSIPSGATIDGIVVEFERKASQSSGNNVKDSEIKIVKGGTIQTTNKADTATNWSTTEAYFTYGSSTELWGTTWTDSDINASDFGVVLKAVLTYSGKGSVTASVDHVKITVYYTTGGGGGGTSTNPILYVGN